jgi:zinc D-Ala-D-Ala carboxypeptidase
VVGNEKEKVRYFNYSEFDSPDVQGSGQLMDKELLDMLDDVRDKFDKPIHINSGFRTPAHNEAVGGAENSSHLKGLAVDIACDNSIDRFDLINCLLDVGFSRIGVAKTFIHADIDPDKSNGVMWTYQ